METFLSRIRDGIRDLLTKNHLVPRLYMYKVEAFFSKNTLDYMCMVRLFMMTAGSCIFV